MQDWETFVLFYFISFLTFKLITILYKKIDKSTMCLSSFFVLFILVVLYFCCNTTFFLVRILSPKIVFHGCKMSCNLLHVNKCGYPCTFNTIRFRVILYFCKDDNKMC